MHLSSTQKELIYGCVLGDAYLQKTGSRNARLRIEHSEKQKAYAQWLFEQLRSVFQRRPVFLERVHPMTKKTNRFVRLQSHASPWLGALRDVFYNETGKRIPEHLDRYLRSRRTLAVWYMDDGYYDRRDHSAHLYLPRYAEDEMARLIRVIEKNYSFTPKLYCRPDRRACQLNMTGAHRDRFINLVRPYLIPSMVYKLPLDPVTTEREKQRRMQSARFGFTPE